MKRKPLLSCEKEGGDTDQRGAMGIRAIFCFGLRGGNQTRFLLFAAPWECHLKGSLVNKNLMKEISEVIH